MELEYDLFERMPDGSVNWRGFARGLEKIQTRLSDLAIGTANECFAIYTPTHDVVGRVNAKSKI